MLFTKVRVATIAFTFFCSTSLNSCSKQSPPSNDSSECNELEADADAAVLRNNQAHTKATCDSALNALKAASDCDDSYKNEYESFGTCP
jgi:hypothetical protein